MRAVSMWSLCVYVCDVYVSVSVCGVCVCVCVCDVYVCVHVRCLCGVSVCVRFRRYSRSLIPVLPEASSTAPPSRDKFLLLSELVTNLHDDRNGSLN